MVDILAQTQQSFLDRPAHYLSADATLYTNGYLLVNVHIETFLWFASFKGEVQIAGTDRNGKQQFVIPTFQFKVPGRLFGPGYQIRRCETRIDPHLAERVTALSVSHRTKTPFR